jgi:hypothetical protein
MTFFYVPTQKFPYYRPTFINYIMNALTCFVVGKSRLFRLRHSISIVIDRCGLRCLCCCRIRSTCYYFK